MTANVTVLLSSAGRRGALVKLLRAGAALADVSVHVLATDASPLSAAGHLADSFEVVPRADSPEFVDYMADLVERTNTDVIVPTIDTELAVLAANRDRFQSVGANALVSDPKTIEICSDKKRSSRWIGQHARVPTQFEVHELDDLDQSHWPLFFKPLQGSSSIGAHPVADATEVRLAIERFGPGVIEQLVTGHEFTMDCWVDAAGVCQSVVPRQRLATRAGEIAKGQTIHNPALEDEVRSLVTALPGARGTITVQAMVENGENHYIEINPRFGGGYPLSYAAGATSTAALVAEAAGVAVDPEWFVWQPDTVMLRYDDAVFLTADQLALTRTPQT